MSVFCAKECIFAAYENSMVRTGCWRGFNMALFLLLFALAGSLDGYAQVPQRRGRAVSPCPDADPPVAGLRTPVPARNCFSAASLSPAPLSIEAPVQLLRPRRRSSACGMLAGRAASACDAAVGLPYRLMRGCFAGFAPRRRWITTSSRWGAS